MQPNSLAQHQTMFFGPAHTLTQYSSLPRRSHLAGSASGSGMGMGMGLGMGMGVGGLNAGGGAFQRNTPIRRSTGIPEHHLEYFVPRSISEFNLSGVGDLALPPPRRFSPNMGGGATGGGGYNMNMGGGGGGGGGLGMNMGMNMGLGLPHGLQLGPPQTLLCSAATSAQAQVQAQVPPPPPAQLQIMTLKPRSEKMVTFEDESKQNSASGSGATVTPVSVTCPHGVPTTPRKSGDMFM